MTTEVKISAKRLEELERSQRKLNALEAGGVDNWEWYDESLTDFRKEEQMEDQLEKFIDNLNDVLAEAQVEEPAGHGCGYAITFDEDFVKRLVRDLVKDIQDNDD